MQHPLKAENTPTDHYRWENVPGTTQNSFFAKFKATSNKLGQKRNTVFQRHYALCDIL